MSSRLLNGLDVMAANSFDHAPDELFRFEHLLSVDANYSFILYLRDENNDDLAAH